MPGRPLRNAITPLRAVLGGAIAVSVAACANISLSDNASGFAASPAPPVTNLDASVDGSGGSILPSADAGGAPTAFAGNPLCDYADVDASAQCLPDDSSRCAAADASASDAGDAAVASACHVVSSGSSPMPACSAPGPGLDGDQCQTGADCAASFECVGSPGRCRHYCCSGDSSCSGPDASSPTFCDVQTVAAGDLDASSVAAPTYRVPVCVPVSPCKLLEPGQCPSGETCVVAKDDGTTSCVAIGTAGIGESCEVEHCAEDLTCLGSGPGGRVCYQLCQVDAQPSACPAMQTCTSSAQIFKDPSYGICQ